MVNLSFRADAPYVDANRWIASLSDGTTVFEDRTPNAPSSWIRLQQHVKEHRLRITRLRLQAYGVLVQLPPLRDDHDVVQLDGYWHSKRHTAWVDPVIPQTLDHGVGFIQEGKLHIKWIKENGSIEDEVRAYDRSKDLAGILNAEISVDHDAGNAARRF
jgi:hypothetical protein